jgi:hypothetical protein
MLPFSSVLEADLDQVLKKFVVFQVARTKSKNYGNSNMMYNGDVLAIPRPYFVESKG